MSRGSILLIYIILTFLLFLLISQTPTKRTNPHHRHRRLKLRSNFSFSPREHDHIPFDPLIADMELRREDKEWERRQYNPELGSQWNESGRAGESGPEWEDFMNAEDYINDEKRFNVTERLVLLFPKIDVGPTDGFVSLDELTEWNLKQAERETIHRSAREMLTQDKNHDGFLSFHEYQPPTWVQVADKNAFGYEMKWWKEEHFNASDVNEDGLLNLTEYNDFLHPADSKNVKLLQWLSAEELRERDTDKDGKLNFTEFFHGLFDLLINNDDDRISSNQDDNSTDVSAEKLFSELDKDNDGYLSAAELLPVIGKIHPSERYYAKQQAKYTILQADTDKDGRLTSTEMVDNPFVFYNAVFNEDQDEDQDDYSYHDEFR